MKRIIIAITSGLALNATAANLMLMVGDPVGTQRFDNYAPGAGYGFSAPPTTGTTINALGYWDQGGDGLAIDHTVALYKFNNLNYDLVASVVVPSGTGGQLIGGYRWVSLGMDQFLEDNGQGGHYYILLASHGGSDPWVDMNSTQTLNSDLGNYAGRAIFKGAGTIGDNPATIAVDGLGSTDPFGWGGGNMAYLESIPEPASSLLLVIGVGVLGLTRRRLRH
jgi:hypothetical protein